MKAATPVIWLLSCDLLLAAGASSLAAEETLQIDKAVLGSKDAWRDITQFLQDQIDKGAVSTRIAQPFTEIGGDPSPGKVKSLIVDYRLNGQPYRLWMEEQFPVAFTITLPSPDADKPGANPQEAAILQNVSASAVHRGQAIQAPGILLVSLTLCASLAALIFSVLAFLRVRKLGESASSKAPSDPTAY